jgi:hypothetical protein
MILLFFAIGLVCIPYIYAQISHNEIYPSKIIYGKCFELKVCQNNTDTTFSIKDYPIFLFQANRTWKTDFDFFEPQDTLARDTIIIYNNNYILDKLLLKELSYSGAYNLLYAFLKKHKNKKFFILYFFDAYQMGSFAQGMFIIFEVDRNNNVRFIASYRETHNKRSAKVWIVKRKGNVFLRSENYNRIW